MERLPAWEARWVRPLVASKVFSATIGGMLALSGALLFLAIAPLRTTAVEVDFDTHTGVDQDGTTICVDADVFLRALEEIPIEGLQLTLGGVLLSNVNLVGVDIAAHAEFRALGPGPGPLHFGYGYGYDESAGFAVTFDFGYGYGYGYGSLSGEAHLAVLACSTLTSSEQALVFPDVAQLFREVSLQVGVITAAPSSGLLPPVGHLTLSGDYLFLSPTRNVVLSNPLFVAPPAGTPIVADLVDDLSPPADLPPALDDDVENVFGANLGDAAPGTYELNNGVVIDGGGDFLSLASFSMDLGTAGDNLEVLFTQLGADAEPAALADLDLALVFSGGNLYKFIDVDVLSGGAGLSNAASNALLNPLNPTPVSFTFRVEVDFLTTNGIGAGQVRLQKFDDGVLIGTFSPTSISPDFVVGGVRYVELTFEVPGFSVFAIGFGLANAAGGGIASCTVGCKGDVTTTPTDTTPGDGGETGVPGDATPPADQPLGPPDRVFRAQAGPRGQVTVAWDEVAGALSYRVDVCRDAACDEILDTREVSATEITLGGTTVPLEPGKYYWRVTAVGSEGPGTPSEPQSFNVASISDGGTGALPYVIILVVLAVLAGVGYLAYSRGWLDRFRKPPSWNQ